MNLISIDSNNKVISNTLSLFYFTPDMKDLSCALKSDLQSWGEDMRVAC